MPATHEFHSTPSVEPVLYLAFSSGYSARYVKLNPIKGCGQARDSWVERGCVCLRSGAWHFRTTAGVRRGKVTPILSIVLGSPYASFEIAEIGQALFDDLLLFRAVFERFRDEGRRWVLRRDRGVWS